jgi:hypothetical protein
MKLEQIEKKQWIDKIKFDLLIKENRGEMVTRDDYIQAGYDFAIQSLNPGMKLIEYSEVKEYVATYYKKVPMHVYNIIEKAFELQLHADQLTRDKRAEELEAKVWEVLDNEQSFRAMQVNTNGTQEQINAYNQTVKLRTALLFALKGEALQEGKG